MKQEEGVSIWGRTSETYETHVKSITLLMVIGDLHGLWEGLDFGFWLPS